MPRTIFVETEADLARCLTIRKTVFVAEQGVSEEEEIDEQDVIGVGHHVLLWDDDGRAVATARYQAYGEDAAKIQRVAVLAEARQYGFGRDVMRAIETLAWQNGFREAVLDAQCHAEGFYKKLGYETVSDEPFYDAGIQHVRMKKKLI